MKNLHIRFEYNEALDAKKQLLYSQLNLLEVLRRLREFRKSRKNELLLKGKLKSEFSALNKKIKEIEEFFPKEIEEEFSRKKSKRKNKSKEPAYEGDIEAQLREIQEKLAALQ